MAIKAEGCMLNNWVLKDGKYKQLKMCGFMDLHSFPSHFEGIPLSESVLLKIEEFENISTENTVQRLTFDKYWIGYLDYFGNEFLLCKYDDKGMKVFTNNFPYLHQLQNFVYVALGQHLTFKP